MRWLTDNVAGGWSLWCDKVSAAQCGLPLRRQRLAIKHILLVAFSDVLSPSPLPPLPPGPLLPRLYVRGRCDEFFETQGPLTRASEVTIEKPRM
eukprot:9186478-Pyramimonas_sp.AAC.1